MTKENNIYNKFDGIICITLEDKIDRINHVLKYSKELNIPIELYKTKKHPLCGKYGCFKSHYEVWKLAYKRGYNNVLIFEDDFIPTPGYNTTIIENVIEYMKENKDWDIIKLGYISANPLLSLVSLILSKKQTNNLINYCGILTQSYILSKNGIRKLIKYAKIELSKNIYKIDPIDEFQYKLFNKKKIKSYCTIPIQFDQKWSLSTNNSSHNIWEYTFRKVQSIFEKTNLFYYISLIAFYRSKIIISIVLIAILLNLIIKFTLLKTL